MFCWQKCKLYSTFCRQDVLYRYVSLRYVKLRYVLYQYVVYGYPSLNCHGGNNYHEQWSPTFWITFLSLAQKNRTKAS